MRFDLESHSAGNVTSLGTLECHRNRQEAGARDDNVTRDLASTDQMPPRPTPTPSVLPPQLDRRSRQGSHHLRSGVHA